MLKCSILTYVKRGVAAIIIRIICADLPGLNRNNNCVNKLRINQLNKHYNL